MEYTEHLMDTKSQFQKVDVYKTKAFGNLLTLDGLVMTTERDEFFYHEMISHPSLFIHPNPEKVLIIGGGDGGTLREVVKHKKVVEAHLCEIDEEVCNAAKAYFPTLSESFDHPKSKIFIEDGFAFLDNNKSAYQVILVDSTDPIGEAAKLFEESFIKKVYDSLTEDGITVMQCENPLYKLDVMEKMYFDMKKYFEYVYFYFVPIPTYPSGYWSFIMGSKIMHPVKDFRKKRWNNKDFNTVYYNKDIHKAAFALPEFVKNKLGLE
ncbi:MAG: spermidine synthase [Spirochaetes bacterium GWB1_36_13]|nr:MAG: spermidine synthase [Spirochaetes bacterium GWB1_36_13]